MKAPASAVLPLACADASLSRVGGKALSLARLAVAGLPVPSGFLLSTTAYTDFVEANELQPAILEAINDVRPWQAASVQHASDTIRSAFTAATIPNETATQITQAYFELDGDNPAVAVRSSATAEDLPDTSFAGQQDSYLNVRGDAALLEAVRRCWASALDDTSDRLPRAYGYRPTVGGNGRGCSIDA